MKRTISEVLAVTLVAASMGGPTWAAAPDAGGGSGSPVTLTIGTWNGSGSITGKVIQDYATEVSTLSNGNITLEPMWEILPADDSATLPPTVIDQLKTNKIDLAVVGSRYLDEVGITSFDALNAPFLVTSDAVLDAATSSSDITGPMLEGVGKVGLTGLAVWPESLRHFVSFGDPILSAADFAGKTILSLPAVVPDAMIQALGATTSPLRGDARDQAIRSGAAQGIDFSYSWINNYNIPIVGTTTGNVIPYAMANVLLGNPDALGRLNAAQQQVLRDAAAATLEDLKKTNPTEADAAIKYCQIGGRVVVASDADVASVRQALAPVTAKLMEDPVAADLVGKIQAIKDSLPAESPVVPCDGSGSAASPVPGATAAADPATLLWTASAPSSVTPTPSYGNLAVDPSGRLWAADAAHGRFVIFGSDGTFIDTFGSSGRGDGQFALERENGDMYGQIAFAPDGSFYVLDVGNFRVQHFDRDRQLVNIWGGNGGGPGRYQDPNSIAVDAKGVVYVLDDVRDVVETYQPDGTVIGSFDAHPGTNPGFNSVNQMTVDRAESIYVADCCNGTNQIEKFDTSGTLLSTFGGPGSGDGAFIDQPSNITIDALGRALVNEDNVIKLFGPDGKFLATWGKRDLAEQGVQFALGGQDDIYVQSFGSNEIRKYQLQAPFSTH